MLFRGSLQREPGICVNKADISFLGSPPATVLALVGTMDMAAKIVKSAKVHHLDIRNFDKTEKLLKACLEKTPKVILLDFETREAEAFRFLKERRENAELQRAAIVGFVSQTKRDVKREAENGGVLRVFLKTEFLSGLDEIWLRYAK